MDPINSDGVKPTSVSRPGIGSPRRVEGLSDGVFAIVMTLIVLQVAVPRGSSSELPGELVRIVPTLLIYVLTFVTLGFLWFGNRTQSELIAHADHPLVWLNLLFLLLVAMIPFTAALLGEHPGDRLAVILYAGHLTLTSLAHALCWIYASWHPELLRAGVSAGYRRTSRWFSLAPAAGYALTSLIGAIFPLAGLIVAALVPLPFVTGIYYRALARIDRDAHD
jgi:uncharacterized membrane protein